MKAAIAAPVEITRCGDDANAEGSRGGGSGGGGWIARSCELSGGGSCVNSYPLRFDDGLSGGKAVKPGGCKPGGSKSIVSEDSEYL